MHWHRFCLNPCSSLSRYALCSVHFFLKYYIISHTRTRAQAKRGRLIISMLHLPPEGESNAPGARKKAAATRAVPLPTDTHTHTPGMLCAPTRGKPSPIDF